jgi:hypothetical protein
MRSSRRNSTRFALLAAVGLCVALAGCASKAPTPGGSTSSKAEKARKDAEALALSAVREGAEAQARAVPDARNSAAPLHNVTLNSDGSGRAVALASAPKSPPRPGVPAVVRERIKSTIPYSTEAEAEDDALTLAAELVEQKLASLDPPVKHKPSVGEVKAEFVRKDSRTVRPPDAEEKETFARYGVGGNLVYVEYDVEITADQIRELRSQERVSAGIRVLGMIVAVALAGFLFLRADEWTKGYLTRWLAIAAVVLAGGAAAALVFV